jgi:hypothetical protein
MTPEAQALVELERDARAYLADAMNQPGETYPPIFATYVREGVPSASAKVSVDTAIMAIAFALQDARALSLIEATHGEGAKARG